MRQLTILSILVLFHFYTYAQDSVDSKVYPWRESIEILTDQGLQRRIFEGSTASLSSLQMTAWTLEAGQTFALPNPTHEHVIIVKQGVLSVKLDTTRILTPGSMALIVPNDKVSIKNTNNEVTIFYLMSYTAKIQPMQINDAKATSFTKLWNELTFKAHDKGGVRHYFDQPTVMTSLFEMHVTSLNGLLSSHEPHQHSTAEIMLMIGGNTEMQIGDAVYAGSAGDVYFIESEIIHAIRNVEKEPCMYFAFQWK